MKKDDVIDLVQDEDGTYSPQHVPMRVKQKQKPINDNIEQFFLGMDTGLDLVENVKKRVDRLLKLKK